MRITLEIQLQLVEAMKRKPLSYSQLAQLSGLRKSSVERWVRNVRAKAAELQKQGKPAPRPYVADYTEDARQRQFVPQYRWGDYDDQPRPGPRYDAAERMRRMRARRANPDLF